MILYQLISLEATIQTLCRWLCRYVMETGKEDGHPYPSSTLRSLLSGINRVLQSNHAPFSVLDKTNPCFRDLLKTLDSVSSDQDICTFVEFQSKQFCNELWQILNMCAWYGIYSTEKPFDLVWLHTIKLFTTSYDRKWQSFWKKTAALNSEYLGRELNLRLTANMRL